MHRRAAHLAAAIGEPSRARMLYCLMDGRAKTSTELAVVAGVSPATASAHLGRLAEAGMVGVHAQGRHRYYRLAGPQFASLLETLAASSGAPGTRFASRTPAALLTARTCYDHLAGRVAVQIHEQLVSREWLHRAAGTSCTLTAEGRRHFEHLGVDLEASAARRRRFACECLDWSERRPHLGGALGASLLALALRQRWVVRHLDSRALRVTAHGWRELREAFGIRRPACG